MIDPSVQLSYDHEARRNWFRQSRDETRRGVDSANFGEGDTWQREKPSWRCCELRQDGQEHVLFGECQARSMPAVEARCTHGRHVDATSTACLLYNTSRWEVRWDWRAK